MAPASRWAPACPTPSARTPPALGSIITFRYQELSDDGVPRFPSYVGVRIDAEPWKPTRQAQAWLSRPTCPAGLPGRGSPAGRRLCWPLDDVKK